MSTFEKNLPYTSNSKHFLKVKSIMLSTRIREDIMQMVEYLLDNTKIEKRDFIEIALIEHCLRFDVGLMYEGIDFKEYLNVVKLEKLRQYRAKIKATKMSKFLFMNRVKHDLWKLISYKRPVKEIKEVLAEHKKTINLYPDNQDLIKEFEKFEKINKENYKEISVKVTNELKKMDKEVNGDVKLLGEIKK